MNTMIDTTTLGSNIRKYRISLNLTQAQLATMVGKSIRSIQEYEKGTTTPSLEILNTMAEALGTSLEILLGYSKEEEEIEETQESFLDITRASHLIDAYNLASKYSMLRNLPQKVTVTLPLQQVCCPICGVTGGIFQADGTCNQFCGNCGQALLWPDDEDNTP